MTVKREGGGARNLRAELGFVRSALLRELDAREGGVVLQLALHAPHHVLGVRQLQLLVREQLFQLCRCSGSGAGSALRPRGEVVAMWEQGDAAMLLWWCTGHGVGREEQEQTGMG